MLGVEHATAELPPQTTSAVDCPQKLQNTGRQDENKTQFGPGYKLQEKIDFIHKINQILVLTNGQLNTVDDVKLI